MPKSSKRKTKQAKRRAQKRLERLAEEAAQRPVSEKLLDRIERERRLRHTSVAPHARDKLSKRRPA